jgi:hypothetical protein
MLSRSGSSVLSDHRRGSSFHGIVLECTYSDFANGALGWVAMLQLVIGFLASNDQQALQHHCSTFRRRLLGLGVRGPSWG